MAAGRPKRVDRQRLYTSAETLYWEFRTFIDGNVRWESDPEQYEQLVRQVGRRPIPVDDNNRRSFRLTVEDEIRSGRLPEELREQRLRELDLDYRVRTRAWMKKNIEHLVDKEINVPGQPEVLKALLHAGTAAEVRKICEDAYVYQRVEIQPGVFGSVRTPKWPINEMSRLPSQLERYAEQFIEAKRGPRYPRSSRPSTLPKQLWFLSRTLAGAVYGESPRTSINLVGSKRPEEIFEESSAAKPKRKKRKMATAHGH